MALIEEWAKHIPEMEVVALQEAGEYEMDEMNRRMALAVKTVEQNGAIRRLYDFAWVMAAVNDGVVKGLGEFKSPQSFIDYLKTLGVDRVPSRTTLSTWYGRVLGKYPEWEFTDKCDPREKLRRHNVVRQLLSALNRAAVKK